MTLNTNILDLPIRNDDLITEHELTMQELLFHGKENDVEILQHYNSAEGVIQKGGRKLLDTRRAVC